MITASGAVAYPPDFNPGRLFLERVPAMVADAREAARTEAVSYRGMLVGVSGFAYTPETRAWGVLTGGNIKPSPVKDKICGEIVFLERASNAGYNHVAGVVVAGPTDRKLIGGINHVATATLDPCPDLCQPFFREHPLMRRDTAIVSVGIDEDKYRVHTSGQLYDLYIDDPDFEHLENELPMYGFDEWDRRVALYNSLVEADNNTQTEAQQLPMGRLVQLAMTASLKDL